MPASFDCPQNKNDLILKIKLEIAPAIRAKLYSRFTTHIRRSWCLYKTLAPVVKT
jgi:hypothetical protein